MEHRSIDVAFAALPAGIAGSLLFFVFDTKRKKLKVPGYSALLTGLAALFLFLGSFFGFDRGILS